MRPPQTEEERQFWDHWRTEMAIRLQTDYGHDFRAAWLLADYSASMLQSTPVSPLILVTGI